MDSARESRPMDANKININEPHEVNWWMRELSITRKQLEDAVKDVGYSSFVVRRYLAKK